MIPPIVWTVEELERARQEAAKAFRRSRLEEPLEMYLEYFDKYLGVFENLLEQTVDLSTLNEQAADLLKSRDTQDALRYLTGPPISLDDLRELAEAKISGAAIQRDPETVNRVLQVIRNGIDRRRFPWFTDAGEVTEADRTAAVLASAALVAAQKTATWRRTTERTQQEGWVEDVLLEMGFEKISPRRVKTHSEFPAPKSFCRESHLALRKADFLIGLHDGRCFALECKVSNSSTNSVKRLKEAESKAQHWLTKFGTSNVVPAAVLGGVYKVHNLIDVQESGLRLFWGHDLAQMTKWIHATAAD